MARETVKKRTCFVCLNSIELCQKKALSNSSSRVPAELYSEFINFASKYLKLPVDLKNKRDYRDRAVCEFCGIRVENVIELYSELQDVELRLSSKLEELGKLMKGASKKPKSSDEEEAVRNFVANECLQKYEEVQGQSTSDWDPASSLSDEEMEEEKEIKLEVEEASMDENMEDEPDPLMSSQYIPEPSSSRSVPNEYCGTNWSRISHSKVAEGDDDDDEEQDEKSSVTSDLIGDNEEPMSISGESEDSEESCSEAGSSETADSHASDTSDFELSEETEDETEEKRSLRRSPRRSLKTPLRQVIKKRSSTTQAVVGELACQQCDRRCLSERILYNHLLQHEKQLDNKGKPCCFCNKSFVYDQTHYLHLKKCHKSIFALENPFTCDDKKCSSSFATMPELNGHLKAHSSSEEIQHCSICGWGFFNQDNLFAHELVHKIKFDGGYQCPCCKGSSFPNVNKLQKHYRKTHSKGLGSFKCLICQKGHPSEKLLFNHLVNHHEKNSGKGQPCWFCNKSFGSEGTRELHIKLFHKSILTKGMPFTCDEKGCEEKFTSTKELNEHLKLHSTSSSQPIVYCSVCQWGFSNQDRLELHTLVHTVRKGAKGYQCPCCSTARTNIEELQTHYNSKHGNCIGGGFKCPKCDLNLVTENSFNKHMKKHEENQEIKELPHCIAPPPCTACGRQFLRLLALDKHRKEVHNLGVECPDCPALFSSRGSLSRHYHRIHNPEKKDVVYPCAHCESTYRSKSSLYDHVAIAHPTVYAGSEKHECPHCHLRFHRNVALWKHLEGCAENPDMGIARYSTHKYTKKYPRKRNKETNKPGESLICHVCGKVLSNPNSLKYHQSTHNDQKDFLCHLCPLKFTVNYSLKGHLRLFHGKEKGQEFTDGEGDKLKRFTCLYPACGEMFGTDTDLRSHVDGSHSTPNEFMCNLCGKVFANQQRLTRHNIVHTKEKRFKCEICLKEFPYKNSLKEHLSILHRDVSTEQPWYHCDQPNCEEKFKDHGRLYRHLRRVHGVYAAKVKIKTQKEEASVP